MVSVFGIIVISAGWSIVISMESVIGVAQGAIGSAVKISVTKPSIISWGPGV